MSLRVVRERMVDEMLLSAVPQDHLRGGTAIEVKDVFFGYGSAQMLAGVDLKVERGECVAVMGASGSGKSTLLQIMAGLIVPDSGSVVVENKYVFSGLTTKARDRIRLQNIGMVFQFGELIPELTLCENVELPLLFRGVRRAAAQQSARSVLASVGLVEEVDRFIWQVSGGQQQRASIARALVAQPAVVLADEPTGSLDDDTSTEVMDLLVGRAHSGQHGLVLVTHSQEVAARCDRRLLLRGARLCAEWS